MNTRLLAAKILVKVLHRGESLTAALAGVFSPAARPGLKTVDRPVLAAQDKAFIQALCYGVCRCYYRLDFILSRLTTKPVNDMLVKALLLIGLYQLAFMKVKPHAAVSETVLASRQKPWAKALINAVLRNYLRGRESLEAAADDKPAAAFSHPDWFIDRLTGDWPEYAEDCLRANNAPPPMSVRVNLSKIDRGRYGRLLAELGVAAAPAAFCPSALTLDKPIAVDKLPGFADGWVSVQDIAGQLAPMLLDCRPGQRVLDVCAAPGGKAAHLLETQPRLAELVAVDIEAERMARVAATMARLGLNCSRVTADAASPGQWWDGRPFERILLDAPCTASGVVRRHPDIKLLRRPEDVAATAHLQRRILDAVWPLLAPGGMLLYATCSVFRDENERQIEDFLARHPDAAESRIEARWGRPCRRGRQILTGEAAMDGFYYARMEKT